MRDPRASDAGAPGFHSQVTTAANIDPDRPHRQAAIAPSTGALAADIAVDLVFRRKVAQLHARGPRLIAELLAEIAADRPLGTYIDDLLDRYLALPDEALDLVGGRNVPPAPLTAIEGGRI